MSWTMTRLNALAKTENLNLSDKSNKELLDRLQKDKASDTVALRLAKYYHKKDNNEAGGSVTSTTPQYSIKGVLLSRQARVLGGKLYNAENLYIFMTKATEYPQTQDRDAVECPAGTMDYGTIIEAQSWLKKTALTPLLPEDVLGKEITFTGSWGSYKGKPQFSVWGYDDEDIKEYDVVKGKTLNQARKDPYFILDNEELKYTPMVVQVIIKSVTVASLWEDGDQVEQDSPFFQLNCEAVGHENIKLSLTWSPASEGDKCLLGLDEVPLDFSQIFIDAEEEEDFYAYAEAMLEGEKVLVGFTLNSVKPYPETYVLYGNLWGIYNFSPVDVVQTTLDENFGDQTVQVDEKGTPIVVDDTNMPWSEIMKDGHSAETWKYIQQVLENGKRKSIKQIEKGVSTLGGSDTQLSLIKEMLQDALREVLIIQPKRNYYRLVIEDDPMGGPSEPITEVVAPPTEAPAKTLNVAGVGKFIQGVINIFGADFGVEQLSELVKAQYKSEEKADFPLPDKQLKDQINAILKAIT